MNDTDSDMESLIKGGIIGAALGAILSKDKEEGAVIGALLGSAIWATFQASEAARIKQIPVFVEEDGKLYEIGASGSKRFIKKIAKPAKGLPKTFKLK